MEEQKLLDTASITIPDSSSDLGELFGALAKAQGEYLEVTCNESGHWGKYADLVELVRCTRPALSKYDLSVLWQVKKQPDGSNHIRMRLGHKSNQWIASDIFLKPTKVGDHGSYGAAQTYMMRATYRALVGIVDKEQDDAEKAPSKSPGENKPATEGQVKMIYVLLKGRDEQKAKILTHYQIEKLEDLYIHEATEIIDRLKQGQK